MRMNIIVSHFPRIPYPSRCCYQPVLFWPRELCKYIQQFTLLRCQAFAVELRRIFFIEFGNENLPCGNAVGIRYCF